MEKYMSVITSSSDSTKTTNGDDNENSDTTSNNQSQNSKMAICGDCGKELDSGWNCSTCRTQCPICNRSLINQPNEYCERCFKLCEQHGLYSVKTKEGCIQCMKQ